jgi:hypothetical protein
MIAIPSLNYKDFNSFGSYLQDDFVTGDFWIANSKKFWNEQI